MYKTVRGLNTCVRAETTQKRNTCLLTTSGDFLSLSLLFYILAVYVLIGCVHSYAQGVQRHGCSKKKENRKLRIEKIGKIGKFVLKNRSMLRR